MRGFCQEVWTYSVLVDTMMLASSSGLGGAVGNNMVPGPTLLALCQWPLAKMVERAVAVLYRASPHDELNRGPSDFYRAQKESVQGVGPGTERQTGFNSRSRLTRRSPDKQHRTERPVGHGSGDAA